MLRQAERHGRCVGLIVVAAVVAALMGVCARSASAAVTMSKGRVLLVDMEVIVGPGQSCDAGGLTGTPTVMKILP